MRSAVSPLTLVALLACVFAGCQSKPALPGTGAVLEDAAAREGESRVAASSLMGGVLDSEPLMSSAECPIGEDDSRDADKLLDHAGASHERGEYAVAYACADVAVELVPNSIEAHHVRAAALAAIGHYTAAQLGFTMALALDPDDPETLAATADFYVNVLPGKSRDATRVGLLHTRRAKVRAESRRRRDNHLRARLALLEGQALNDLGRADEALLAIDTALELSPSMIEARHERGVSLFNLCRFDDAKMAFIEVLRSVPDDPYAHHHVGLILERAGESAAAAAHFERAQALAAAEFFPAVAISADEFRREVNAATAELSPVTRALLASVELELADVPNHEDLVAVEPPFSPTILGLFRGVATDPSAGTPSQRAGPDQAPIRAVVLYRQNLARAVRTREELNLQIRRTLLHEIGHLEGLDEDELRRRGLD